MSAHTFEYYEPVGYYQRGPIEDRAAESLGKHRYVSEPPPPPERCTARETKVQRFTPGYAGWPVGQLVYFALRWRAEPLRLILHHAGLPYTLNTISSEEWPALKPSVPGGCLPAFTPEDGATFSESLAIAKHLASLSGTKGLLPKDASAAQKAERLFELANAEPMAQTGDLLNCKTKEEAAPKLAAHVTLAIAALRGVEPELRDSGGPFFGGDAAHFGELGLWATVDNLCRLDASLLDQLGAPWRAWYDAVRQLEGVAAYLECRPAAGSGKVGYPGSMIASMALDPPPPPVHDYETTS